MLQLFREAQSQYMLNTCLSKHHFHKCHCKHHTSLCTEATPSKKEENTETTPVIKEGSIIYLFVKHKLKFECACVHALVQWSSNQ